MLKKSVRVNQIYVNFLGETVKILAVKDIPDVQNICAGSYWGFVPFCVGINQETGEYQSFDDMGNFTHESDDDPDDLSHPRCEGVNDE
jgi:hypothetical protein